MKTEIQPLVEKLATTFQYIWETAPPQQNIKGVFKKMAKHAIETIIEGKEE